MTLTVVTHFADRLDKEYDDFASDLPENESRYRMIDLCFETNGGRPISKLVLVSRILDTAPIRTKVLCS